MKHILTLTALLALTACAQTTQRVNSDVTPTKLHADTATYFETSRANVRVGNFKQGVFGTSYNAKVRGQTYDCKYFRGSVTCARAF